MTPAVPPLDPLQLLQILHDAQEIRSACGFMWMRMAVAENAQDAYDVSKREFAQGKAAFERLETSLPAAITALIHSTEEAVAAAAVSTEEHDVLRSRRSPMLGVPPESMVSRETSPTGGLDRRQQPPLAERAAPPTWAPDLRPLLREACGMMKILDRNQPHEAVDEFLSRAEAALALPAPPQADKE